MMKQIMYEVVLAVGLLLVSGTGAFSVTPMSISKTRTVSEVRQLTRNLVLTMMSSTSKPYPHQEFHRAIECASEPGLCDVDELMCLADDLENHGEKCFFADEKDAMACEKEKKDRLDVSSLLRLDAEVLLREYCLDNANVFRDNVEEARLRESWNDHQEGLDMYSNY